MFNKLFLTLGFILTCPCVSAQTQVNYFPSDHSGGQAVDITENATFEAICGADNNPRLPGLNLARAYYGAAACPRTREFEGEEAQVHYLLLIDDTNRLSSYLVDLLDDKGLLQTHRGRQIIQPAIVPMMTNGEDSGRNIHVLGEMAYRLNGSDPGRWFGVLADNAGNAFCELPPNVEALIQDYARQTIEMNNRIKDRLLTALTNFQRAMQFASEESTRSDIVGALTKTALEEAKSYVVGKIADNVPGFDVAVSFVDSAIAEVERAEAASRSYAMGVWLRDTERWISNCLGNSRCQVGSDTTQEDTDLWVRNAISERICSLPVNRRDGAVNAINQALASSLVQGIPVAEIFEKAFYEGWINGHYSTSGEDHQTSAGTIDIRFEVEAEGGRIQFENDSRTASVSVEEYGDEAETGMNELIRALNSVDSPLDFKVHKKVCFHVDNTMPGGRGWSCWWLNAENDLIRRGHPYENAQEAFNDQRWRDNTRSFRRD